MPTHSTLTRPAAVAGTFYPANEAVLRRTVDQLLLAAQADAPAVPPPKAVIVPHAGYPYSGPVAAALYAQLKPSAASIERVVLLGPAHRMDVRGLALPAANRFSTPLGEIEVDAEAAERLRHLPQITESDAAHAAEHCLEVQLPFLQTVLGRFRVVPLLAGSATATEVADVLLRLWGGDETLIVVSSDLSHYLPYEVAQRVDRASVEQILAGDSSLETGQACGAVPINGLIAAAAARGLVTRLVDLRNSGDTAGDRDRVVGYAALRFDAPPAKDPLGASLLEHARHAIATALGGQSPSPARGALDVPGTTFVTLRCNGELRGCIGSLVVSRSLADDVAHNARAAAFHDPRFAPLAADELDRLTIEVSLLSPPARVEFENEGTLLADLAQRRCGVALEYGECRATFLPQVWSDLPDPRQFISALRTKAGIPTEVPTDQLSIAAYTVRKWSEGDAQ